MVTEQPKMRGSDPHFLFQRGVAVRCQLPSTCELSGGSCQLSGGRCQVLVSCEVVAVNPLEEKVWILPSRLLHFRARFATQPRMRCDGPVHFKTRRSQ